MDAFLHSFGPYTYLVLMLASLAYPLARSFEKRVHFVRWWPALGVGIFFNALYFIPTDVWFTAKGYWAFSNTYTLGPRWLGLPIEEWLFFTVIPYACVFIYACVKRLIGVPYHPGWLVFGWLLVAVSGGTALLHIDKAYTGIKLGSAAVFLATYLLLTDRKDLGNFLLAYILTELPFLLVNGVLTYLPVVTYNDNENLSIRMAEWLGVPFFNIPVEDNFYSLMMLTLTVFAMNKVPGPHRASKTNPLANGLANKPSIQPLVS
jgi:lycopene cyclase domain-containing protein